MNDFESKKYQTRFSILNRYIICIKIAFLEMLFYYPYLVIATAISYTGNLLSRNRYFPISVKADAESIASLPTLLRSKYGVASRPWKKKWRNNYVVIKSSMTKLSWFHEKKGNMILTLEMIIPAMDILTPGSLSNLYRKSIPFQNDITYLLMATLSLPWSLEKIEQ